MFHRTFSRFIPVGMAFVASNAATNNSFLIKPAFCSDEDDEFSRRKLLFQKLARSGRQVDIPESLFLKLPNGKFHPVPPTIIDEYNLIISDNQKIEEPSPKRKSSNRLSNTETLVAEVHKVSALFRQAMPTHAQNELDKLIRKQRIKSVTNLPEKVLNILPTSLKSSRAEYERMGQQMDSKQFAQLKHNAAIQNNESPDRESPYKRSKKGNSSKIDMDYNLSDSFSQIGLNQSDNMDTLSAITSGTKPISSSNHTSKSSSSIRTSSGSVRTNRSSRNNNYTSCDQSDCKCKQRIKDQGCCSVCRIYYECGCGDCKFIAGKESMDDRLLHAKDEIKSILNTEAIKIQEMPVTRRKGYIYDRRKETVESVDTSGREYHNWRVGEKFHAHVSSCGKAFTRFYQVSSRTLNTMKTDDGNIFDYEAINLDQVAIPSQLNHKSIKSFEKRSTNKHGITLDDDEKGVLRWAPSRTNNATDELYGWLHEHFSLVAEDMPNR